MPGSAIFGGGGGVSSAALGRAIDTSADIDRILASLDGITALLAVRGGQTISPFVQQPMLTAIADSPAITPPIYPPTGDGEQLYIQVVGWLEDVAAIGTLEMMGSDGQQYLKIPLRAGAGFTGKLALPIGIGVVITLSSSLGSGFLNYSVGTIKEVT